MNILFSLATAALAWANGVALVNVNGSINPGSASYIVESLTRSQDADLFVIQLNTPGGLISSTRTIIAAIADSHVPVAVWVGPSGAAATSAGALIAMSAHVLSMAEGTNIGAAHPVGGAGEDIKGVMGEKVLNDTAALARAQAALRGRDVTAAEEIVTKSHSFSSSEAVQKHIADFTANDVATFIRLANGRVVSVGGKPFTIHAGGAATELAMSLRQRFLHFVADPNVSALLLSLGGLAVWAEVSSGFSSVAAGVVGVLCFVLGLVSLETLPVTTGGEILLILGFAFLVTDAFVTNHGVISVGGLVCLLLGGLFLIDPGSGSMHVSLSILLPMVFGIALVLGFVGYALSRGHAVGDANLVAGASARVSSVAEGGRMGTAYVNGELWHFEADEPVRVGDELTVGSVQGLKLHLNRRT